MRSCFLIPVVSCWLAWAPVPAPAFPFPQKSKPGESFVEPRGGPASGRRPPLRRGSGGPAANPYRLLERFNQLEPDQRERLLNNLPPERRERFEQRLEEFNHLPEEQRDSLLRMYDGLQRLSPEERSEARQFFRQFREMPPDRRKRVREEIGRLQQLPPEKRKERIDSEEFRKKYQPGELRLFREAEKYYFGLRESASEMDPPDEDQPDPQD